MPSPRSILAAAVTLLLLAGCANSGPPNEAKVTQDIDAGHWLRSLDLAPVEPATVPNIGAGGIARRQIP